MDMPMLHILQEVGVKETHFSKACLYLTKSEQEVHACGTCPGPILNHSTTTTNNTNTNNNNNDDNNASSSYYYYYYFKACICLKLPGHPPQRANLMSIYVLTSPHQSCPYIYKYFNR